MFFTKLNKEFYERSLRSIDPELRDYLARPYKTKYNDFHIIMP